MSRFFTLSASNGRHHFVTPQGKPFWSIGLNHLDPATLRYEDSGQVWRDKYGGQMNRWIGEGVVPDLQNWGFNTIGWTQEVVVKGEAMTRHSPGWTPDELRLSGMPFCFLLPFASVHQWDVETRRPDVRSREWAEWCDYVARLYCADLRDDENLVGYFFSDCPNWIHPSTSPRRIGPWFDPQMLQSDAGQREFAASIETYYATICKAIRRYDPHHLLLGDRLEAKAPLPSAVLESAARWCDVLSLQFFAPIDEIMAGFRRLHAQTGQPILLADAPVPGRHELPLDEQGRLYTSALEQLRAEPYGVGWHLCGAYLENHARRAGLKNRRDEPSTVLVEAIARANRATTTSAEASSPPVIRSLRMCKNHSNES